MSIPIQARNKSWLFVFVDETRTLHFYDAKGTPREAFERIITAKPKHEMLDVLAFTSADEAKNIAISLHQARTMLEYYTKMIPAEPAGAPPAAAGVA